MTPSIVLLSTPVCSTAAAFHLGSRERTSPPKACRAQSGATVGPLYRIDCVEIQTGPKILKRRAPHSGTFLAVRGRL